MQIPKTTEMNVLIDAFNDSDNPTDRFAYAAAIRDEMNQYAKTLDETILPMYQKAIVRELYQKRKGEKQ